MRKVLKSRLTAGVLILVVVCLGIVFAGDVIVKEGTIEGVNFQSTGCTATGTGAIAFGYSTEASEPYSTAMGYDTEAIGGYSTAMGGYTQASGPVSTAMGYETTASGGCSTAMGLETTASGDYSTAMGRETTASGDFSTAMGYYTAASGPVSTAMGWLTTASGGYSTAMGVFTTASGYGSTAIGCGGGASGNYSTAIGYSIMAGPADYTTAIGKSFSNTDANSFAVGYNDEDLRVEDDWVKVSGDLDVTQKVTMGTLILPVKSTTGDPASPVEGQIYVNTYDNKVRVYADEQWRDLATW